MHDPTMELDEDEARIAALPDRIGPYQVLGLLGEGGMGRVYLARESQPPRTIALKVVRGLSGNARARFQREIKLLAQLEHPGICRLYAAGEDVIGGISIPWLALELIRGHDLRTHIERTRPDLGRRLQLRIAVCRAAHHAHERGVIHRDLKPGNILVDNTGQPKILDFGIARLHDDETGVTRTGQVLGTVPYMSPEQLSGSDGAVDARSDVYALGVIAYEMVSGRLPHPRLTTSTLFEALEIIRHEQPPRLSSLSPEARGDLEKVVMKALATESARRYASAGELADDLQRLLDHQPVHARAPTLIYRSTRFVRRHRALTVAASVVFVALLATATISTLSAQRARVALVETEARTSELRAVNDFVEQMLSGADPELGGAPDTPLRQVLDEAAQTLEVANVPPRIAGQVALLLGRTWSALGESTRAQDYFDRAQHWLDQGFGPDSEEAARALFARLEDFARSGQAESAVDGTLALAARLSQIDAQWARHLGFRAGVLRAEALEEGGDSDAAITLNRQLLDDPLRLQLPDAEEVTDVLRHNLAYALLSTASFNEAETLIRATMESESARLGVNHPQVLYTRKVLGQVLHRQGRLDKAVELYANVYEQRRQRYGAEHPLTLSSGMQLAAAYNSLDRPAEAEPLLRHALAERIARGEGESRDAIVNYVMLISTLEKLDQPDAALAMADKVIAMENGQANRDTLAARSARGVLLLKAGRIADARATFNTLLRLAPAIIGPNYPHWPVFLSNAGEADLAAGEAQIARERLEPALELLTAQRGPDHPLTQLARSRLAQAYTALGLGNKPAAPGVKSATTNDAP